MAMSLLKEIQDGAVDGNADLGTLLRKCRVLAARLKNGEFKNWVQYELDGYPLEAELPEYRKMRAQSFGHFFGAYGSGAKNAPIPIMCIPEEFRKFVTDVEFHNGVGALQDLISRSDGSALQEQWPADLVAVVASQIYERMNLAQAWKAIPPSAIVSILETVRNRILNFVLEIEDVAPDAGESSAAPSLTPEQVGNVFNTYIMGNVGNVASGNSHVEQHSTVTVNKGDFESLAAFLKNLDVDDEDVEQLKEAVEAEPKATKSGFGRRVASWIGQMVTKSAQGLWKVAAPLASNLLTKAVAAYYGLPTP
jgi:hypothetical protein